MQFEESKVRKALQTAWSLQTAKQWNKDNPASGQCNVTAAVISDMFGCQILRTWLPDVWHYYNAINGQRIDLTDSQFTAPGALFDAPAAYQDEPSSAEQAMAGIPQHEFDTLKAALTQGWKNRNAGPQR